MNIVSGKAPFIRSPRKTKNIMLELLIGLGVLFVATLVYYFSLSIDYGLKAILIMVLSILTGFVSDLIAGSLRYSKEKDGKFESFISRFLLENFSVITSVIFAFTLPIGTPWWVVILGSLFATLIAKHLFGGFGANIFNPAAMGRIFVAMAFGSLLKGYIGAVPTGDFGGLMAGATLTTQVAGEGLRYITGTLPSNMSMLNLWLGNYNGALGETFTILILVIGTVLAARDVINWRTPVFMFVTVVLSSFVISLIAGVNVGEYILLQFGLGGLMFGAVFMFTDPVTSPTSNYGKALIGIIAGFLNVLLRIGGNLIEGTVFSIVFVNILSPFIDRLIEGRTFVKVWRAYVVSGCMILVSVGILSGIAALKINPISTSASPTISRVNNQTDDVHLVGTLLSVAR